MKTTVVLALLISPVFGQPRTRMGEYALILQDPPVAQVASSRQALSSAQALVHRSKVDLAQRSVRAELARRKLTVHRSSQLLVNAIYVDAGHASAADLSSIPGVKRVQYLPPVSRDLNAAVGLVNASTAWSAVGGTGAAGSGIKIGIIDSGIDQNHPGFQDSSLRPPAGFPKGDTAYTNSKVIVARSYVSRLAGTDPVSSTPDDLSPRDRMGHGTAIAMIAAGVQNSGPLGVIQGVAPKAFLGNYKIFGSPGLNEVTFDSVVGAAIDDAIADGMDVVTLSINEGDVAQFGPVDGQAACDDTVCDVRAQRVENATKMGLTVVASAGNSGDAGAHAPTRNSIHTPGTAPSAITVGATNNSHVVYQTLRYNNGNVRGLFGDGTRLTAPLSGPAKDVASTGNDGLGCSAFPAGSLSGRVALIQRGTCYIADKVNNAQAAGAIAVILYQAEGVEYIPPTLFIRTTAIPVFTIGNADGKSLKSFLSSNADATVTLDPAFSSADNGAVNTVAGFSSRGPSIGNFAAARDFALKPELVAPGVGLYTATQKYDPNGDAYHPSGYTTVAGTSYAVPFVAGAVALVKQKNPNIKTPAQLKSAVVNTASASVQGGAHLVDSGAGLLNIGDAVNVAATLEPATIGFGPVPAALPANRSLDITNVSGAQATFTFNVRQLTADSNARVTVAPSSVNLAPGAKTTVTVSLTGGRPSPGAYEGFIDVSGAGPTLHLPYTYFVGDGVAANLMPLIGATFLGYPGDTGWLLALRLTDQYGVPVTSAPVNFRVQTGGGKITGGSNATDVIGQAAWNVDMGQQIGDQIFSATVGGMTQNFEGFARTPLNISQGGIVNAATSRLGSGVAPGSYISIFGHDLATTTAVFGTPYLPVALAAVAVSFDAGNISVPGRIHFVSPGQVNVQIPWELQGQSSVKVKLLWTWDFNFWTDLFTVPLATYSPGIFAITDLAGRVIDSSNPAKRGDPIIIYANGLGPVDNQPTSGEATPATPPLANTKVPASVTIGSSPTQFVFSGLTPGSIGLYQVNVVIPGTSPTGTQTLTLSIGGQSTTANIAVQ
jgi:minor extracellular serine protease Vpr